LAILNRVHNDEKVPKLEGHILARRLREDDKEYCKWLDQEFGSRKIYFDEFEGKKTRVSDKYKASIQWT